MFLKKIIEIEDIFSDVENRSIQVFALAKDRGEITPSIESDFIIFLKKAREVFDALKEEFAFEVVYRELPKNEWVPMYIRLTFLLGDDGYVPFSKNVH